MQLSTYGRCALVVLFCGRVEYDFGLDLINHVLQTAKEVSFSVTGIA